VSLRYALLAGLSIEPRSGYDLARWFERVASHYWAAGHSSIYPTLATLEDEGLVEHEVVPGERGPARKIYTVTPTGRQALVDWVGSPAAERPIRDEQMVKALCYGLIPPERALELLAEVRERHARTLARYEELAQLLDQAIQAGRGVDRAAGLGMVLTLRRGVLFESGYVTWCDEAAALIREHARTKPAL
jgi:DNA-binding PadR family transcriptional regulator